MKLITTIFFVFLVFTKSCLAQGGALSCAALQSNPAAYQSCATNVPFTNQLTNNSETIKPQCFRISPRAPTWFFMQINGSGPINLQISQISNLGNGIDVDFAIWGPFATLNNVCPQLTDANLVDCSYEPDAVENVAIPNTINGQYYILLVDNYEQISGQITISQTGGTGSSDCGFLSSVAIKDTSNNEITQSNYCKPASKALKANVDITDFTANPANLRFNYRWKKDGIVVATINNSLSNNNVYTANASGLYRIEIAAYDITDPSIDINNIPFPAAQSDEIALAFFETPILSSTPTTISQCDLVAPNNNGFTTFNLTQAYNSITNSMPGISLQYYLDAALTQLIPQPATFTNTISTTQTIYVRGDFGQSFFCPSNVAQIRLVVSPTSLAVYPDMLPVCPQLNQNFGLFDFATQRQIIKNSFFPTATVTILFYATVPDASSEQNELTNVSQLPPGITVVYTKVKSGINCSNVGTFYVEVKKAPKQNALSNVVLCRNDSYLLNVNDATLLQGQIGSHSVSYHSTDIDALNNSSPITKNIPFVGNLGVNNLVARVLNNITRCFVTIPFTITIFPNPALNATPTPYRICGNATGIFNLNSQLTNLMGTNNYQISFHETQADLNNSIAISNPENYSSTPKTIFVKAVDNANNGCISQTTLVLEIEPKPGSSVNPSPFLRCNTSGFDNFDLTSKQNEMAGNFAVSDLIFKYYTSPSNANANTSSTIADPTNYTNTIKNYQRIYVRISNVNPTQICVSILYIDIYVSEFPANNLDVNPYKICANATGIIITEAKIDTKLVPQIYSFVWYTGHNAIAGNELVSQNLSTLSTPIEGLFSVKITNYSTPANCQTVANFSTKILTTPTTLSVLPDEIISFIEANVVTVSATPQSADYEYQLNFGTWQNSNVFTNLSPGSNIISVRNKLGCDAIEKQIIVADFRRFFTPNGDSYNDYWKIDGDDALDITQTFIYDKYGKLLYQHLKSSNGWDGTFNGQPLPADDYWFRILYKNKGVSSEFKGHFTLKR